jgi:hypothetical protein
VLEVATFIFILFAFEYVAGGHLFPLDLLLPALHTALNLTAFPYMLYFPSACTSEGSMPPVSLGLMIQAARVLGTWLLARLIWNRGLKHYSAGRLEPMSTVPAPRPTEARPGPDSRRASAARTWTLRRHLRGLLAQLAGP